MDKTTDQTTQTTSPLEAKAYYALLYGLTISGVSHFIFLLLFYFYRIDPLFYLNIFSVALFASLVIAVKRSKQMLEFAMIATGTEFILHQSACVYYIGLDYGFQYYLMIIPSFIFVGKFSNRLIPFAFSILSVTTLIVLSLYGLVHLPPYTALYPVLEIVKLANITNAAVALGIISGLYVMYTDQYEDGLLRKQKDLYVSATVDALTSLYNRKHTAEKLEELHARAMRAGRAYVLAIMDIDDFKKINDAYGHETGDKVLIAVAKTMRRSLRRTDVIGRWGGEEFLILLPDTELENGLQVLMQLKEHIAAEQMRFGENDIRVTATIGAIESDGKSTGDLLRMADKALYQGKKSTKNCVVGSR